MDKVVDIEKYLNRKLRKLFLQVLLILRLLFRGLYKAQLEC